MKRMVAEYRELECSIVFPRSIPVWGEVPTVGSAPPGTVYVYNLSSVPIQSIASNAVIIIQGPIPPLVPGSSDAPSASFTRSAEQFLPVQVNFSSDGPNWGQTLNFNNYPLGDILTFWCYWNGFILTSSRGGMIQMCYTYS
jgi:hypothetical protein